MIEFQVLLFINKELSKYTWFASRKYGSGGMRIDFLYSQDHEVNNNHIGVTFQMKLKSKIESMALIGHLKEEFTFQTGWSVKTLNNRMRSLSLRNDINNGFTTDETN